MTDPNRTEPEGFEPFDPAAPVPPAYSAVKNTGRGDPTQTMGWERATLEKLAFASLKEQKATRRWKTFVRLSWLLFFIFLVWFGVSRATPTTAKTTSHTAVVEIKGEIANGADASAEFVVAAMKTAFEDDGAKAVVLLINSPGGSPVQAGIINDEIKRLKTKYNKPVYAVVEETCASAAYYIAAATDKIFVDKASIVGSIGVLMDGFGFTGTMEKFGVERRLIISGENKGFLDPFSPVNDAQRAHAQQLIDQIHEQFINVVKTGRGDRLKLNTPGLFSGLFWSGQQAIDLGLADQLGNVDYVAREIVKAEEVIDYTRRDNVAEKLAKKFGAAMGDASIRGAAHDASSEISGKALCGGGNFNARWRSGLKQPALRRTRRRQKAPQ